MVAQMLSTARARAHLTLRRLRRRHRRCCSVNSAGGNHACIRTHEPRCTLTLVRQTHKCIYTPRRAYVYARGLTGALG